MGTWYERMKTVDEATFWEGAILRGWNPLSIVQYHGILPSIRLKDEKTFEMLAGWDQKNPKSRHFKQEETIYWVVEEGQ